MENGSIPASPLPWKWMENVITFEGLPIPGQSFIPIQKASSNYEQSSAVSVLLELVLSAKALLMRIQNQQRKRSRHGDMCWKLCRCTGYLQIVQAIKQPANNHKLVSLVYLVFSSFLVMLVFWLTKEAKKLTD